MSEQRITRHITELVQTRGKVGTQAIISEVRAKFPRVSAREVEALLRGMRNAGTLVASGPDDCRSYTAPARPAKPAPKALEVAAAPRPGGLALTDRDPAPAAPGAAEAPPVMAYCYTCKQQKPAGEFPPSTFSRGGDRGDCRECRRNRTNEAARAKRVAWAAALRKAFPAGPIPSAEAATIMGLGAAGSVLDAMTRDGLIVRVRTGLYRWPDQPEQAPAPPATFVAEPLPFDPAPHIPTPGAATVAALAVDAARENLAALAPIARPAPALEAPEAGGDVAERLAKLVAAESRRAIGGLQAERDELARDLLVLRRQVQQVKAERDHAEAERVRLERDLSTAKSMITETQRERDEFRKKLSGLDVSALRDLRARLDAADRERADAVAERDQARADAAAALELAETAQRDLDQQRERIRALLGV